MLHKIKQVPFTVGLLKAFRLQTQGQGFGMIYSLLYFTT